MHDQSWENINKIGLLQSYGNKELQCGCDVDGEKVFLSLVYRDRYE